MSTASIGRYHTERGGHYEPRGSRVVLRRVNYEQVSPGGIVLPENAREKPYQGVVLAIGPGDRDPRTGEVVPITDLAVGDTVVWVKYAGHDFVLDEEELVSINERDIIGKIKEAEVTSVSRMSR